MGQLAVETTGRRERRKQEVRDRVIEAATRLLCEKPLEEITVEELCELGDVAKKTFYNHFGSKQDLIESISRELLITNSEKNLQDTLEKFATTKERLEHFMTLQAMSRAGSELFERNLVKHAMLDLSSNTERSREKLEANIALYEKLIREGRKLGDVNENYSERFLAEMVVGAVNASAIYWVQYPDYPLKRRFKELRQLVADLVVKP